MTGQRTSTVLTGTRGKAAALAEAADGSCPRRGWPASPNTRHAYAGALGRLTAELGPGR